MRTFHIDILTPFFKRHWLPYFLGILALIAVDILQVALPRLTGWVIDSLVVKRDDLGNIILLIVGITVLIAILRYIHRNSIMGTTRQLEYYLREKLFIHALRLPLEFFEQHGPGKIMALTTNDINAVRLAVGLGIMLLVDAVVMGIASVVVMAESINWELTLWSVAPLPPILLVTALFGKPVHARFRAVQEKFSELTEFTQEMFCGAKIIKGFAAERMALTRFSAINRENVRENMSMIRLQAAYIPIIHNAPGICYVIALYVGGSLIIDGRITIGDFAAFAGYLGLIMWPVMGLGYLINLAQRGSASLERIANILAEKPYESNLPEKAGLLENTEIKIKDLTFTYPMGKVPSLRNISFTVPSGSVVGVVGRTGSGKSTLLKMLLRLYDPPLNTIFIAGREIHNIDYVTLRHRIGYVPQDGMLFSRTIGENIAFDGSYSSEQIIQAAKLAAVKEAIDAKPFGFSSVLGEKGQSLSGGQQQRVSIARAMIKQAQLLLLDDVFSALDYHTQHEVLANIKQYIAGRTAVIVSQRVTAVKDADFIIVLEDGRIAEQGTHRQLVARQGLYFELYKQQLAYGEIS